MKQNGIAFQLPTLAHRTVGIGGGAYATPTTMDSLPPKSPEALEREATIARPGRSRPANLRDQISNSHLWPTPTNQSPRKMMPTPTASDHIERTSTSTEAVNPLTGKSVSLDRFVKFWPDQETQESGVPQMWPTPTANEDEAGTPDGKMQKMLGNHPSIRGETPQEWAEGSLNPTWVSWLMGYPLDWLDLDGFQNPELEGLPPEYLTESPD
jgi:hypothetical protein